MGIGQWIGLRKSGDGESEGWGTEFNRLPTTNKRDNFDSVAVLDGDRFILILRDDIEVSLDSAKLSLDTRLDQKILQRGTHGDFFRLSIELDRYRRHDFLLLDCISAVVISAVVSDYSSNAASKARPLGAKSMRRTN